MSLQNKYVLKQASFLFNEKICFISNKLSKQLQLSKLFMRFDITFRFSYNINLVYLLLISNSIHHHNYMHIFRNSSLYSVCYTVFPHSIYSTLPFYTFSLFHFYTSSRLAFFWSHSYSNYFNKSISAHYNSRSISPFSFYDDYFYGLLDANYSYSVNISLQSAIVTNSIVSRLYYSTFTIPFVNKHAYF
jgi:hypothetical protein